MSKPPSIPTVSDVKAALDSDLNTSLAISHCHAMAKAIYAEKDPQRRRRLQINLLLSMTLLGFGPAS